MIKVQEKRRNKTAWLNGLTQSIDINESDIQDAISNYDKFRRDGYLSKEGAFKNGAIKIGAFWAFVPPSRISVFERSENQLISTLRQPGDIKIKQPKLDTVIQVELIFPDLESINNNLRPIIAQFIKAPFIPIENYHIDVLLNPSLYWDIENDIKEEKKSNQEDIVITRTFKQRTVDDINSRHPDLGGLRLPLSNKVAEKVKTYINTKKQAKQNELNELFKKRKSASTVEKISIDKQILALQLDIEKNMSVSIIDKIVRGEIEDSDLKDLIFSLQNTVTGSLPVVVAMQSININNISGHSQALQCTLTFNRMNYLPYSNDFTFLLRDEDFLKQNAYYSSRKYLRYPKSWRELRDVKIYKQPTLLTTRDLSKSEPFINYLLPTLTGNSIIKTIDNVKLLEIDEEERYKAEKDIDIEVINDIERKNNTVIGTVEFILDGDNVKILEFDKQCRLYGIDAYEISDYGIGEEGKESDNIIKQMRRSGLKNKEEVFEIGKKHRDILLKYCKQGERIKIEVLGTHFSGRPLIKLYSLDDSIYINKQIVEDSKKLLGEKNSIIEKWDHKNVESIESSKINYIAPPNWLRFAQNEDFKELDFTVEVTDLSLEDKQTLNNINLITKTHIENQMQEFFNQYERVIFNHLGETLAIDESVMVLKTNLSKIWNNITLVASKRILANVSADLTDLERDIINIEDVFIFRKKGSTGNKEGIDVWKIGGDKTKYTWKEVEDILKTMPGYSDLINSEIIKNATLLDLRRKYGHRTNYHLNLKEGGDTVIAGVSASMTHKMAPLWLQMYDYPIYQHMGRNDFIVELNLQTNNILFLSARKDLSIKINHNRRLRAQSGDNWYIAKLNAINLNPDMKANGIFKILGINNVLPESIEIQSIPDKPGWFNVNFVLLQNDIDPVTSEELVWSNKFNDDIINAATTSLMRTYTWKQEDNYDNYKSKYPYLVENVFPNMRRLAFNNFWAIFFNNKNKYPKLYKSSSGVPNIEIPLYNCENGALRTTDTNTNVGNYGMCRVDKYGNSKMHNGIDIVFNNKSTRGAKVPCAYDGVVTFAGWEDPKNNKKGYGRFVVVLHDFNGKKFETLYAHLDSYSVRRNKKIKKGDIIGKVGNSGNAYDLEPHLHFEVRVDGKSKNPFQFTVASLQNAESDIIEDENRLEFILTDKDIVNLYNSCYSHKQIRDLALIYFYYTLYRNEEPSYNNLYNKIESIVKRYNLNKEDNDFIDKAFSCLASGKRFDDYKKQYLDIVNNSLATTNEKEYAKKALVDIENKKFNEYKYSIKGQIPVGINSDRVELSYILTTLDGTLKQSFGLNIPDYYNMIKESFIRSELLRFIQLSPAEFIQWYNDENDAKINIEDVYKSDLKSKNDYIKNSNYKDLGLPYQIGSFNSTPADFFFKRYDDTVSFTNVEEKFKLYYERAKISWQHHNIYGIFLYDEFIKKDPNAEKYLEEIINKGRNTNELLDLKINNSLLSVECVSNICDLLDNFLAKGASKEGAFNRLYHNWITAKDFDIVLSNHSVIDLYKFQSLNTLVDITMNYKALKDIEQSNIEKEVYEREINRLQNDLKSKVIELNNILTSPTNDLLNFYTPYGLANYSDILSRLKMDYNNYKGRNKERAMENAFPTFKVYFVEEDNKSWKKLDDFYSYDSVEDIQIVKSQSSASDYCEIIVSNLTATLTDARAVMNKENVLADNTSKEQSILSMFVTEGTKILVKLGYDNNPDLLDRVFLGKVVSIEYGDRIIIKAQGNGAQLHEPINDGLEYSVGYCSSIKLHGDLVQFAMNTVNSLDDFGAKSVFEALGITNIYEGYPNTDRYNSTFDAIKRSLYSSFTKKFFPALNLLSRFGTYDPRFENIYLSYSDSKRIEQRVWHHLKDFYNSKTKEKLGIAETALKQIVEVLNNNNILSPKPSLGELITNKFLGNAKKLTDIIIKESWQHDFDWIFPANYSLWDLLNELKNYYPDHIVTVLPYNDWINGTQRDTIYFGPRDGYYKYTDAFDTTQSSYDFNKHIKEIREYEELIYNDKERERFIEEMDQILKEAQALKDDPKELAKHKGKYGNKYYIWNIICKKNSEYLNNLSKDGEIISIDDTADQVNLITRFKERDIVLPEYKFSASPLDNRGHTIRKINNPDDLLMYDENGYLKEKFPQYQKVQNYYIVNNFAHILSNNIVASSEDMYNKILLKFPDDPTTNVNKFKNSKPFIVSDSISDSNIKTKIVESVNVDPVTFAFGPISELLQKKSAEWSTINGIRYSFLPPYVQQGYNILADNIRPMYRGSLELIGMPSIKPFDIIQIDDIFNDINGPIEVDKVIHKFSKNGFTTTIIPKAIVAVTNPAKVQELYLKKGFNLPIIGNTAGDSLLDIAGNILGIAGNLTSIVKATQGKSAINRFDVKQKSFARGDFEGPLTKEELYITQRYKKIDNINEEFNLKQKELIKKITTITSYRKFKTSKEVRKMLQSEDYKKLIKEINDFVKKSGESVILKNGVSTKIKDSKKFENLKNSFETVKSKINLLSETNSETTKEIKVLLKEVEGVRNELVSILENVLIIQSATNNVYDLTEKIDSRNEYNKTLTNITKATDAINIGTAFGALGVQKAGGGARLLSSSTAMILTPALLVGELIFRYFDAKLFNWGLGKALGRNMIHLIPLNHKDLPMVAGLKGYNVYTDLETHTYDSIYSFLNIPKKFMIEVSSQE